MRFRTWRSRTAVAVLAVLGLYFFILGIGVLGSFDRTNGGQVAVVRNGGPLDNHRIRQVIQPASGRTWVGLYSDVHKYPAQQRFYTITANEGQGDRPDHEVVRVPSKDGVEMGIEGTLYFTLNTDPEVLKAFDDKFGTRKFRLLSNGKNYAPHDGDNGWSAFLDTIIRPVIDNDLREQINTFDCAQLVSSCALVQLGANQTVTPNAAPGTAPAGPAESSNGNIAAVQEAINKSLAKDLEATLGAPFLIDLKFNLVRITLPTQVQEAVNKAQAAFAGVSEAQARVAQARADADANKIRQSGYESCPACAAIDQLKAIPPNVTTFAPGAGFAITPR